MWRLKVINGCSNNDDVLLPLVPQTSLLLPFYSQWRDEDEDRHKTAERIEAERQAEEAKRLRDYKKNKKRRKKIMMMNTSETTSSYSYSSSSASSRYRIAVKDWLQKIPHVAFGRHTQLPEACRLRHVCVSRLHCRVVYVSDAATHKVILSIYPPAKKRLVNDTHKKTMSNNNSNNNNNNNDNSNIIDIDSSRSSSIGSTSNHSNSDSTMNNKKKKNGKDENEREQDHDDPSVFHGPHYRLLNCGSNPLYVNDTPLPWGESRCLRENDVVAFLENPFDEEGGVLQPLRPEDILPKNENDNESEKSVSVTLSGENKNNNNNNNNNNKKEEEEITFPFPSSSSTARVLFNSMNHDNPSNGNIETKPSELASQQVEEKQRNVFPVFVEVNGKRIARYRPLYIPPALLKPHKTNPNTINNTNININTNTIIGTGGTPLKQQISLLVGHNRLVGGDITMEKEKDEQEGFKHNGMSPAVNSEALTPSPKLSFYHSPQQQQQREEEEEEEQNNHNKNNKNTKKKEEEEESVDNDYIDVVGDVVSPLQQRVVPSLRRSVGPSATPDGNRYHNNNNNNNYSNHNHSNNNNNNIYNINNNNNNNNAVCEEPSFSVVSARLPVYVFARRSPSPVEFTRQAHTIGRLNPQKEEKEEKDDKKRNRSEEMTEWVQEEGKEIKTTTKLTSSIGTAAANGGRKRGRPPSKKRR